MILAGRPRHSIPAAFGQTANPVSDVDDSHADERAIWSPPQPEPRGRGAMTIGALAAGAVAIGFAAFAAIAIGRLVIGSLEAREMHVGHLTIGNLKLGRIGRG